MHTDDVNPICLLDGARAHLRAGRTEEARRSCIALTIREPASAEGLMMLGLLHQLRGDLDGAGLRFERALMVRPDQAECWGNRAALRTLTGMPSQALTDGAVALSLAPALAIVYALSARLLYQQQEYGQAAVMARRALILGQDRTELHVILIDGLRRDRRLGEARLTCRELLDQLPQRADLWILLGQILAATGEDRAAASAAGRAILLEPANATALCNRGDTLLRLGEAAKAVTVFHTALIADPQLPATMLVPAWLRIGEEARATGDGLGALRAFEAAVHIHPTDPALWSALALAAIAVGQQGRGEAVLHVALMLDPASAGLSGNLATLLVNEGRVGEALRLLRRALVLDPGAYKVHSNLLFALQYQPDVPPAEQRIAHRTWSDRHAAPLAARPVPPFANGRDPERLLRVGFVSADLKRHPVGYFLAPFLAAYDRDFLTVTCYASQSEEDGLTKILKGHAEHWCQVSSLSDEDLAKTIRADAIDILIDLSGHTAGHRLLTFARRPAPVQLTWLGYVHTTGLPAIDGILGGGLEIPTEASPWFEERLVSLPHGRFCYEPPPWAPPVAPPPSLDGRPVTFGSFNTLAKLSDQTVALWARVMEAVPKSRLLLKARPLQDPKVQNRILKRFEKAGLELSRIELRGWSSHTAMLAEYGDIDLALDPQPFSGGLTSCEALWMGVPVLTKPGDRPAGRQSAHFLTLLGLPDLIAWSAADYVRIATDLAHDRERLAQLRSGMRQRMRHSPLLDGAGFARALEDVLRQEWRRWCRNQAA
ncbi:tetratricopeptide repeat protein [Azospirillum sp. A1-3]|uniref:tetratricopeptide repeat protein n=1 Tax=Azospirillum sp. A1-3 TaxID=185874 RepID=UPI002077171C|nr:tetratricopeptide repeat protein [Azospirillum sp. A1-3]MCM8738658.1 tetratricopeptide repeat protein [Azospirillum sp. A1-3]